MTAKPNPVDAQKTRMVGLMAAMIPQLPDQVARLRAEVKARAGVNTDLAIVSVEMISEDNWRIVASGTTHAKIPVQKVFCLRWCQNYLSEFYLVEILNESEKFRGRLNPDLELLAIEIAILIYGKQIPRVLSRQQQ